MHFLKPFTHSETGFGNQSSLLGKFGRRTLYFKKILIAQTLPIPPKQYSASSFFIKGNRLGKAVKTLTFARLEKQGLVKN